MSNKLIAQIKRLNSTLLNAPTVSEKVEILQNQSSVKEFLRSAISIKKFIDLSEFPTQLVLLSIIALGEGENVFHGWENEAKIERKLDMLARQLLQVERFYNRLGGFVGYYLTVLQLMDHAKERCINNETYLQPPWFDIGPGHGERDQYVQWGIEGMPKMAEIYPIGGAGDRLNLRDPTTNEPLPAAELSFCGYSLIELLFHDLQAREFLYKKITGKELITPVVLMTSLEKDNDSRIRRICEMSNWFNRPKSSFYFITQPMVPVITIEGHLALSGPFEFISKPGGHGVLWKLMEDQGAFEWLKKQGKSKALIRQINNPLAGIDDGIFAFTGIGLHDDKTFGFASCPRFVNASEGMNVLVKETEKGVNCFRLTNIEYTEFSKKGIQDLPDKEKGEHSRFPANTNILFVDLEKVRAQVPSCPVPGMIINLKTEVLISDDDGKTRSVKAARLESTMQNIADMFITKQRSEADSIDKGALPVYLTYNLREKTIGVTKCSYNGESNFKESPEGCFYTLLTVNKKLLEEMCEFQVPEFVKEGEYLSRGPNLIFLFHSILGPNHDVVAQKIRKGKMAEGSELQVNLTEVDIENFELAGSCVINGDRNFGSISLKNVRVQNKGIDRSAAQTYWKNQLSREEVLEITLQGKSEFCAENVSFMGDMHIIVPDGVRLIARQKGDQVVLLKEKIDEPSWKWIFGYQGTKIMLRKGYVGSVHKS